MHVHGPHRSVVWIICKQDLILIIMSLLSRESDGRIWLLKSVFDCRYVHNYRNGYREIFALLTFWELILLGRIKIRHAFEFLWHRPISLRSRIARSVGETFVGGKFTNTKLKWTHTLCQSEIPTSLWIYRQTIIYVSNKGEGAATPLPLLEQHKCIVSIVKLLNTWKDRDDEKCKNIKVHKLMW